jgi:hypothetical protein
LTVVRDAVTVDQLSTAVAAQAHSDDPVDQLAAAVTISGELRALADELLDRYVSAARQQQRSWSDIGVALGVSKQAAQQASPPPSPTRRRGRRTSTKTPAPCCPPHRFTPAAFATAISTPSISVWRSPPTRGSPAQHSRAWASTPPTQRPHRADHRWRALK